MEGGPEGFLEGDFDEKFFSGVARSLKWKLLSWRADGIINEGTQITTLVSKGSEETKLLNGVYKYTVVGLDGDSQEKRMDLAIKIKCSSADICAGWVKLFQKYGAASQKIAGDYWALSQGVTRSPELEVLSARHAASDLVAARFRAKVFHSVLDVVSGKFCTVSEFIDESRILVGGHMTYENWNETYRLEVLREVARFHGYYINKTTEVEQAFCGALERHPRRHLAALPLHRLLHSLAVDGYSHLYTAKHQEVIDNYFTHLEAVTLNEERYPMTYVHNDFHPGNLWLLKSPPEGQSALSVYDWESSCLHVPQRDVAAFLLCSTYPQQSSIENLNMWRKYAEYYRHELLKAISDRDESVLVAISDKELFFRIFDFQVLELYCNSACLGAILPPDVRTYPHETMMRNILYYIENIEIC